MAGEKKYPHLFFLLIIFLHILSAVAEVATNSSDMILYEVALLVRVYKDGRVERLSGTEIVPPSFDPRLGVLSKDIVIHPELQISARLFLPKNPKPIHKLPLLVYFHGGGFFTESPFSPIYNNHLKSLVAEANVVAVSVNYRLAPEHPLPIAYQDSWLALKWVFSHCEGNGTEVWLKNYVDFQKVYLGGDSAGGNIAHNMAIWAGLEKPGEGIIVHGMFLNCPHFWGNNPIGNEAKNPKMVDWVESIWIHAYPNTTGFDDPLSNPAMDPNISKLGCKKVLVYVAQLDVLRDRGWYYEKVLRRSKWDGIVKVVEVKDEDHVFNLRLPNSSKAKIMLKQLALFLNDHEPRLQTSVVVKFGCIL